MELDMPTEVWEYTPNSGRTWEQRFAQEAATAIPPAPANLPVRAMDVVMLGLLAAVMMWFAHQFRTERVQGTAAAAAAAGSSEQAGSAAGITGAKNMSFENCKLVRPGLQREQLDGIPDHVQLHPYVYTTCDGVQVTLWSEMK